MISSWKDTKNGIVNILGSGPSLFHVDIKLLEKHDCIYVNSSALILPEKFNGFKIWLSLDRLCIKWSYFWRNVISSSCLKLVENDYKKYEEHLSKYNVMYFEASKNEIEDDKLCGVSSVPAAIDLALKMGYQKILLFGIDHRFVQGKSHFWEYYPSSQKPKFIGGINISKKEQQEKFDENISYFKKLKEIADNKNVEIINCAKRTSALDVFPKIPINDGLKM